MPARSELALRDRSREWRPSSCRSATGFASAGIGCTSRSRSSASSCPGSPASAPCRGSSSAFQLALVLLAAVGIDSAARRGSRRAGARVVALGLAAVVVAESAMSLVFVRVPTAADDGGVDTALRARPKGVVLELPISSSGASGVAWPMAEGAAPAAGAARPRPACQRLLGLPAEGLRPAGRDARPLPASPTRSASPHRLGVRYVVLRTQLVGQLAPATAVRPDVDTERRRSLRPAGRGGHRGAAARGRGQVGGAAPGGLPRRARALTRPATPAGGVAPERVRDGRTLEVDSGVLADGSRPRPHRPMIRRGTECRHVQRRFDPSAP